jgi:hypothetical protein
MAKSSILTGARAKVLINGHLVGLFSQCTWSIRQGKDPAFILGRYSPAEIVPTTQEPVSISLSGYRVVDSGPYKVANATLLKNLLNEDDFSITVLDRQTNKTIFTAVGCRVQGWSSGVAARGVSDIRVDVIGIRGEDEFGLASGGDDESSNASNIDDGT